MDYLPNDEEQKSLREELLALAKQRSGLDGHRTVCVLPTDAFFPDKWTPDAKGVWRLCERIMSYAGLSSLASVVMVVDETDMPDEDAAAVFHGLDESNCYYRVRMDLIDDPMGLAATLAHEVAHAYREKHGLVRDGEEEELLTDLTTVYLGFGILNLNASQQHRSSGVGGDSYVVTLSNFGYLSPQSFAYLLALQATAQQWSLEQINIVQRHLSTNQTAFFNKSLKKTRTLDATFLRDLNASLRPMDDDRGKPAPPVRQLDEAQHILFDAKQVEDADPTPSKYNEGRPTFRVRKHHGLIFAVIGAVVGLAGVIVHTSFAPTANFSLYLIAIGAVSVLACWFGRSLTYDICSDTECIKQLPADVTKCPKCGGSISGVIKNANERLAAEEELEEKRLGNLLLKNRK